jgi:branched-chain amino acid transport system permease protein
VDETAQAPRDPTGIRVTRLPAWEPLARRAWPPFSLCALLVVTWVLVDSFGGIVYGDYGVRMFLNLMVVLSLQIFSGNSGVLSFGQAAFVSLGAYFSALLTIPTEIKKFSYLTMPDWLSSWIFPAQLSPLEATLAGGGLAMVVAAMLAPPIVRLAGVPAGIATLAILVMNNVFNVQTTSITRGTSTLIGVPKTTTLLTVLAWALIFVAVAFAFKQSRFGLRLRASRENERAAKSVGVRVPVERAIAWTLAGFVAGVAGALYGHYFVTFSPGDFYFNTNGIDLVILPIAMLVVGGMTSVTGAVVGCYFVTIIYTAFNRFEVNGLFDVKAPSGTSNLALAVILLLVLMLRPKGISAGNEISWPGDWSFSGARHLVRLRRSKSQSRVAREAVPERTMGHPK